MQLPHPFSVDPRLELDLEFAVEANVRLGLNIKKHRRRRLRTLQRMAEATRELDDLLRKRRPVSLDNAPGPAPMFAAVMVVLLHWPDHGLPSRLASGFELAGDVPASGVYRPCAPKQAGHPVDMPKQVTLRGKAAVSFVDELEADRRVGAHAQVVYDLTLEEVKEGLAEPLADRAAMDAKFGRGRWRPLPRHVIWQADKWRPIDDGKRSCTNALTTVSESIVCVPPEFMLLAIRKTVDSFQSISGMQPPWAEAMKFSTEDWWKGFRQIAPTAEDRGLAVAAVQIPKSGEWRYSALKGLPFGLGSAVNQLNRLPMLATALARRILYLISGHYVDDNVMLEMEASEDCAQSAFRKMMGMLGIRLSDSKRQAATAYGPFLGHMHDLTRLRTDQAVCYGPRPKTRDNLIDLIDSALSSRKLTSGAAAKTRGIATWLDTGLAGRCCRGAMCALTARQYWEKSEAFITICTKYRVVVSKV